MTGASLDLDIFRDIPGYRGILKAVLKCQIQLLVEQLSEHTGEESVLLSANVTEGTLSHLGSESGKGFLVDHTEVKRQYLGYCLKRHQKRKSEFMAPSRSQHGVQPAKLVRTGPESYMNFQVHKKPAFRIQRRNSRFRSSGKQFSSVFSKGNAIRSTNQKLTGNSLLTGISSGLTINQSGTHQNSNRYDDQRSSESLNSQYDSQTSAERDESHSSEVVIKTEVMSDDNEEDNLSSEPPKKVVVKVERPDEIDDGVDKRTRVNSDDIRTFGDELGQQYSPNVAMETEEGNQCEGSQSFEYVLDQDNSTDILSPWKPEDDDKNRSQNFSKRKQSLPSRIAKSGEIREYTIAGSQKFGTDNITYTRMQEDAWSHDDKQDWSSDNIPKDETSYGDISDDKSEISKGSDMMWTEETFQTNSPGELKSYMKTPQIDGLFVSRGEGRFEKLIKCDDCGKVCRTSNMSRHRKRYCTALSKEIKFKNNLVHRTNVVHSPSEYNRSVQNVGNSVYIDNPENEQIRLDLTASDFIGHSRQSNLATTRKVVFPVASGASGGCAPIKIKPNTAKDGTISSNVVDNNDADGKYIVTKLGLRRPNAGLNKTIDRSEKSNAGLNETNDRSENSNAELSKANNGTDKMNTRFSNTAGTLKIISVGLSKSCAGSKNSNVQPKTTDLDLGLDKANTQECKNDSGDGATIIAIDNVDSDRNTTTAKTENDESNLGLQKTVTDESKESITNVKHFQCSNETGRMDDIEQTEDSQPDLVINQNSPPSDGEVTDDSI